jgi:hypothetical protein
MDAQVGTTVQKLSHRKTIGTLTGVTKKKKRLFNFPVMQTFTCCKKITACQYDNDNGDVEGGGERGAQLATQNLSDATNAPAFEMLLYLSPREKAAVLISM